MREKTTHGNTTKIETSCGDLFVTLNRNETEKIIEVFITMGKAGGCESCSNEAMGRLISLIFRLGGVPEDVIRQLQELKCNKPSISKEEMVLSCADAIAKILAYEIR